jgi:hypothetical protein
VSVAQAPGNASAFTVAEPSPNPCSVAATELPGVSASVRTSEPPEIVTVILRQATFAGAVPTVSAIVPVSSGPSPEAPC